MKLVITLATNASLTKYEVKMAEYRTSSFLVFKDQVEAQVNKKMQKKDEANIKPLRPNNLGQ